MKTLSSLGTLFGEEVSRGGSERQISLMSLRSLYLLVQGREEPELLTFLTDIPEDTHKHHHFLNNLLLVLTPLVQKIQVQE